MRSHRGTTALLVALSFGTLAGACSLNPREDPTRFYVLTDLAEDSDLLGDGSTGGRSSGSAALAGLTVGSRLVSFPAYLNRSRMVTRLSSSELEFMETDRWAEPLEEAFHRALGADLEVLLGTDGVILGSWYATVKPQYVVTLHVIRFERDAQGAAHLVARWELFNAEGDLLTAEEFETTEPGDPASISSSVQAQSRSVAGLAREISDAIRKAAS
jgi:uncharacterized lipoprotein YmbA